MKILKGIIATSHVDKHGETILPEALESMVEQINTQYVPVGIEHDPRIPPLGRLISAKLVELDDGAVGVEGVIEMFEEDDIIELQDNHREIPMREFPLGSCGLASDRSFRDEESREHIKELATLLGTNPEEDIKKAVEPVSILTIAGAFALGSVAGGFLNKVGADSWDSLKEKIKLLQRKKQEEVEERIVTFDFHLTDNEGNKKLFQINITNPTGEDIESFLTYGLKQLDELAPKYNEQSIDIKKIVLNYANNELTVQYSVRKDAVPICQTQKHRKMDNPR